MLTRVEFTPERLERAKENLAGVDFVGVYQHASTSSATSWRTLRLGPRSIAKHANRTEPVDVPASFLERIAEDNAMDRELYEFACRLDEQRRAVNTNLGQRASGVGFHWWRRQAQAACPWLPPEWAVPRSRRLPGGGRAPGRPPAPRRWTSSLGIGMKVRGEGLQEASLLSTDGEAHRRLRSSPWRACSRRVPSTPSSVRPTGRGRARRVVRGTGDL